MYKDLRCRACGQKLETQEHVLNECTKIHMENHTKVPSMSLFRTNNKRELQKMADNINMAMKRLENPEPNTSGAPTNEVVEQPGQPGIR